MNKTKFCSHDDSPTYPTYHMPRTFLHVLCLLTSRSTCHSNLLFPFGLTGAQTNLVTWPDWSSPKEQSWDSHQAVWPPLSGLNHSAVSP